MATCQLASSDGTGGAQQGISLKQRGEAEAISDAVNRLLELLFFLNLQGIVKERNQTITLIDKITVKNANLADSPALIFGTKKLNDDLSQSIAGVSGLNFFLCMNGRKELLLGVTGIDGDTLLSLIHI